MRILFISEIDFALNNATTLRVKNLVHTINDLDIHQTLIIGYGDREILECEGIRVFQTKRGTNFLSKTLNFYYRGFESIKKIESSGFTPDIIIYNGFSARFLYPLLKYSRKKQIKLIIDIVEWFDYWHLLRYYLNPLLVLDVHIGITKLVKKCDGVIAISSFLENYYLKNNKKAVRIPIILKTLDESHLQNTEATFNKNKLNLIYAGTPGKKDLLKVIIRVVEKLTSTSDNICLHILGISNEEMQKYYGRNISDSIVCYGCVDQSIVPEYLSKADFSVLLRPPKRYAQAGFPTKFVESLNSGLPVIANCTSDICMYLEDGYNGFILADCSERILSEKIQEVIGYGRDRWIQMRKNAKQTFKQEFERDKYCEKINEFILSV